MLPARELVAVHAWPQDQWLAVQALRSVQAMAVISVPTPANENRLVARNLVRSALRETLGALLDQPAASIALASRPGGAIRINSTPFRLSLSISHSPGVSVAAIYRGASIGTDVMRIETDPQEPLDWMRLACDYMGPQVTALLQTTPPETFPSAFARAWTGFEASLKCLGLALTEWSPELGKQLAWCRVVGLNLPANYCGSVAIGANIPDIPHPGPCANLWPEL